MRAARCLVTVDERTVEAIEGQSLAAALVASGLWQFRVHPVTGEPRGPYCGMGICFECELEVDGLPAVRACMTPVRDRMVVRTGLDVTRQEEPAGG